MDFSRKYPEEIRTNRKNKKTVVTTWLILTLILLGLIVAFYFQFIHKNIISVVTIEGLITSEKASNITKVLDKLEKDDTVKAVILKINSPGGEANAVEEIYFKLLSVKSKKPVVVSIDSSATSGAYFISVPSDYIFAESSSEVGGVGVVTELPEHIERPDLITSGPFKLFRSTENIQRNVELLRRMFIETIRVNRQDKLKIDATDLSSAEVYIGIESKELGLIDEVGGLEDAILKSSELASIRWYEVNYVYPSEKEESPLKVESSEISSNSTSVPSFYYVYVNLEERK